MRNRRTVNSSAQLKLGIEEAEGDSVLREIFAGLELPRTLSFERAMRDAALAICIRNLAEVDTRRRGRAAPPGGRRDTLSMDARGHDLLDIDYEADDGGDAFHVWSGVDRDGGALTGEQVLTIGELA